MRAEKFDKPGEWVSFKDFNLKSEIFLFGKKFRVCDCDEFTKKFYAEKEITLNPCEAIPEIDFEDKLKNVDLKANKEAIYNLKEYIEVKLGGGHPNKNLHQFLLKMIGKYLGLILCGMMRNMIRRKSLTLCITILLMDL
jgi:hypothetical protein